MCAGAYERAGQEDGGGDLVETFKRPVVDGNLVDLKRKTEPKLGPGVTGGEGYLEEELCSGGDGS